MNSQSANKKQTKATKCKVCRSEFVKRSMTHKCCSPECAQEFAKLERIKSQKKQEREISKMVREKKDALRPISEFLERAQAAFNRYVRVRDHDYGCISCDKTKYWPAHFHAGHYKSVGADSYLRFNLWNVHKQCVQCNHFFSGNVNEYAKRLPDRIGKDRFEFLESSPKTRKYTREYLERLTKIFNKKALRAEKRLNLG